MEGVLALIVALAVTVAVTNCATDQTTLRQCAVAGEAKLRGGGTIECSVKKETK